ENSPLIFVGGFPRSGTTLMRVMLDTLPDIRCGQETRVIPKLLLHVGEYTYRERMRLDAAGVTSQVLDSAVAKFILQVMTSHGAPAKRLCNKDPLTLRNMTYLARVFPNSKFVFLVRDGRAVVHSIVSRRILIRGINSSDYESLLRTWDRAVMGMNTQCESLGRKRCLRVPYEHVILHSRKAMESVLEFLEIEWDERVLHHEQSVGLPGGPVISRLERSSDQVVKPLNFDALYRWVGAIPQHVAETAGKLAPMLTVLGYDAQVYRPDYIQLKT
ncbi:predicted protein, partial [Nematostella vectensis]